MTELKKDGIRAAMSERTERETLKSMAQRNPTPTQRSETLEANVHALTVLVCQDCIDLKGEMCNNPQCVFRRRTIAEVKHYLDAMLLCPIVDGKRLILVGDAVTDEDSRRAAVVGREGDEWFDAETAPKNIPILMLWEDEHMQIVQLHDRPSFWFENAPIKWRHLPPLHAATSCPAPAESIRDLLGRFLFDKYACTIEHHRMKVLKHFVEWVETESAAAPPVRTRVEGERWTKEAPVVDGIYWWRADSRDSEPDIHRVVGGIFFEVGEQFSRVVEGFGGEWLGPITPAAAPADNDADVVQRIRSAVQELPIDYYGNVDKEAVLEAITTTKEDR